MRVGPSEPAATDEFFPKLQPGGAASRLSRACSRLSYVSRAGKASKMRDIALLVRAVPHQQKAAGR